MGSVKAPWTAEQVAALNRWQACAYIHPFTCGSEHCRITLVAHEDGWHCPSCDYRQNWAHDMMTGPPPSDPFPSLRD